MNRVRGGDYTNKSLYENWEKWGGAGGWDNSGEWEREQWVSILRLISLKQAAIMFATFVTYTQTTIWDCSF